MRFRYATLALVAMTTLAAAPASPALAAPAADAGYLCCNMRAYGDEIYDSNYEEEGAVLIPFGSPVTVTSQRRRKVGLMVGGQRYVLENHYSRDLSEDAFRARYVVAEDPREAARAFPEKIRQAIANGQVTPGMTREQVRMSLGWPISSENPDPEAAVLRYWLSSFDEVQIEFDAEGRAVDLSASLATKRKIWLP